MAVLFDFSGSNPSVPAAGIDRPVILDWVEFDMDTDATGQILLYKFPDVAFLPYRAGSVSLFCVDAPGGSFAGALELSDSDGVTDAVLVAAGTVVADQIDTSAAVAAEGAFLDVGGKYIVFDITVVGTSTACTMQLAIEYTQNVIKKAITS